MRWSTLLLLAVLAAQPVLAEEPAPASPGLEALGSQPVTIGRQIEFRSKILDSDVRMNLYVPESFAISSPTHTYPVIFANGGHGEQFFSTLVGIVKHLGDRERIPESLVVSLNDMGDIPEIYTHGMWGAEKLGGSGDPGASLRHIEQEVIPYLEKNYRANDYRLLVGVSGSSLFPIHTFTAAPGLFDSHILIAAADMMGMGYTEDATFIDAFEAALSAAPKRRAKLYVGVADGDLENRDDYRANLDELKARLARFEQLDLRVEILPRTDHYEAFLKGMLSALEQNFPHERWSARYRELVAQPGDALENIDRYYRDLSREYGFEILPRADRWNNVNCLRFMTRHLIQLERAPEALAVAKRRVEYQPGVSGSYSGLADAYEANGELGAAVEAQEKAVALERARGGDAGWLEERLRGLREALQGGEGSASTQSTSQ
jgi:predicted alpha/beta superfamily hydrolase